MTRGTPAIDVTGLRLVGICISPERSFCGFKENYEGQATFFSSEAMQGVYHKLGVQGNSASVARGNSVMPGADLGSLAGKEFVIQGVEFEGGSEGSSGHWMNEVIAHVTEAADFVREFPPVMSGE
jgi:hypothetical protein